MQVRVKTIIFLVALSLGFGGIIYAQKSTTNSFVLDRVSLALTGHPASTADKKALQSGAKNLDQIIESYKSNPRFELKLAEFWTEVLRIDRTLDFLRMHTRRTTEGNPQGKFNYLSNMMWGGKSALSISRYSSHNRACEFPGDPNIYSLYFNKNAPPATDSIILDGQTLTNAQYFCGCYGGIGMVNNVCTDCNTADVKPFWNKNLTIKVCKALIHESVCGPDLRKCWLPGEAEESVLIYDNANQYYENIGYGFTMEPGMLIAKIVSGDRPWDDVVTTTDGVVNGSMAMMLHDERVGKEYIEGFMPDINPAYSDRLTNPIYKNADPAAFDKFELVDVGDMNAGIMKTYAFHRVTNGHRAKANRAREALLCKTYQAPEEPQVESAETDLTKRPYCSACHKSIEPMAKFFAQWPNDGNYNFKADENANGSYEGLSGSGAEALGNIFTKLPDYNECAVKRAFEFIVRRPMTDQEIQNILPSLVSEFNGNGKKVWPIMKSIINSPEFIGSGQN